ncbi:MAG: hypothetical protein ACJAXM_000732 [Arenicella sp.]|jgi:hypothetical protein
MGVANASSTYDFSWCDLTYGEVKGEIRGLEDILGDQAASSVAITSVNGDDRWNFDIPATIYTVYDNVFNVVDGTITYAQLEFRQLIRDYRDDAEIYSTTWIAYYPCTGYFCSFGNLHVAQYGGSSGSYDRTWDGEISFNRRTLATVAEPGSVILLSLGLVGLAFSRYRKQS